MSNVQTRIWTTLTYVKKMSQTSLTKSMPAIAFFGRMAFAFAFLISAIQEYADHYGDGGPLEKKVGPALNLLTKYGSKVLTVYFGMQVVAFDVRFIEFALISAKATGALWFIFGQSTPAYFLLATQIFSTIFPFPSTLNDFTQNLTLIGALLYYIGYKHTLDNLEEEKKNEASTSNASTSNASTSNASTSNAEEN